MSDLGPVVCALDVTHENEPALVAAVEMAARTGDALHLVTVRPPPAPGDYRPKIDPEASVRAVVEVTVDRALGAGACAEIGPHIAVARREDPAASIASYASEVAAGIVVVGTHGRSGLQRLRQGSVAEALVRQASCPVLVVPNHVPDWMPGPQRPILVPVDFSETSAQALERARQIADVYQARVELLHVRDRLSRAAQAVSALATHEIGLETAAPSTEADLRAFADDCGDADVCIVDGDPAARIVARARALGAGAVVMGTHGRHGLARAMLGSVAEAALRRLPCPVLVVPPGAS